LLAIVAVPSAYTADVDAPFSFSKGNLVAIDWENEDLLRLDETAKFPGPRPTAGQLRHWTETGVKVDGKFVILETMRIGRYRYTSKTAYKRFVEKLNPQ
jgi:hypothetical protein